MGSLDSLRSLEMTDERLEMTDERLEMTDERLEMRGFQDNR